MDVKYERNEIEEVLISQNIAHYKKVLKTLIYQDKIYNKLTDNETREKILQGTLHCSECDNEDAYLFL